MTTVSEAVAKRDATPATPSPKEMLRDLLVRNSQAVGASLPAGYDRDRFVRLLLTAANTNPELFECDPRSFLAAGVTAAQLGLEPNDPRGLAYLVPFRAQGRGKVVQLIIGYRGMLDLARRSGLVSSINAFAVYDGDQFTYRLGLSPTLDHVPHPDGDEDPAKLVAVYAVATVGKSALTGDKQFVVLSRRQIDKVRDQYARSAASPWRTHYVEMALKTALRRLCKWLPQTVELAHAVDADERELAIADFALPAGHSFDPAADEAIEAGTRDEAAYVVDRATGEVVEVVTQIPDAASAASDDGARKGAPDSDGISGEPSPQSGGRRRGQGAAASPPADPPADDDQLTLPDK